MKDKDADFISTKDLFSEIKKQERSFSILIGNGFTLGFPSFDKFAQLNLLEEVRESAKIKDLISSRISDFSNIEVYIDYVWSVCNVHYER